MEVVVGVMRVVEVVVGVMSVEGVRVGVMREVGRGHESSRSVVEAVGVVGVL